MADFEKVKKGLEAHGCGKSVWRICGNCPYRKEDDPFFDPRIDPNYDSKLIEKSQRCMEELLKDAHDLLAAAYDRPEARLLTLEEIQQMGQRNMHHGKAPRETCVYERRGCIGLATCSPLWDEPQFEGDQSHLDIQYLFLGTDEYDVVPVKKYGFEIRCWHGCPTDEQREATPW